MKEQKLITDVFVEGARKGWNIGVNSVIPNVLMAFVIIFILQKSGALTFIAKYIGFIMIPLGLPGESVAVFLAAFLSWGGSAGVAIALMSDGSINANDLCVLLPGMALVGSLVQYMGRVLGVLGVPGRHFGILFAICTFNAYCAMFIMSLIV